MTKLLPFQVIFCLLFLFSATMVKSQTISPVYEVNDTTEFSTLNYNLVLFDGSQWQRKAGTVTANQATIFNGPTGYYYERLFEGPIALEWFGAKGDYDYSSKKGCDDTKAIQKAVNFAATKGYEIRLAAGKKYFTRTIYAYRDSVNPDYPAKPGRLKITGGASGIATGSLEPQGAAFVFKDSLPGPLFECKGTFAVGAAGNTGGNLDFQNVNFIGGALTTDVIYLELTVGQVSFKNLTVQVNNPSGNGITENNTWESTMENILIRGQAPGDGSWTGIGLNIKTNSSQGQVNMKVYNNVDCYRNGYNIRIGRREVKVGTLSPLVFIGGQCSLADQSNLWVDGGTYNLVSIGQQFEGSWLNAIRIDPDTANDLPRNLKFISPYFTGGGKINNGSVDSYAIHIKNGEGVHFDSPLFNNLARGIIFDQSKCQGLVIERPVVRTVNPNITESIFINAYGADNPVMRHRLIDPMFNQAPAIIVSPGALTSFTRTEAGAQVTISNGSSTPTISTGGGILQRARFLNFNNVNPTTITNLLDGQYLKEVTLTSQNSPTTVASNTNISLAAGQPFTLVGRSSLTLVWLGTYWQEVSRSDFNDIIYLSKSATSTGSNFISIPHGLGAAPSYYNVTPTNNGAGGIAYVTADATNVNVYYGNAVPSGSPLTYNLALKK